MDNFSHFKAEAIKIENAVKVNCMIDKKYRESNFAAVKHNEEPYVPIALAYYFFRKNGYSHEIAIEQLGITEQIMEHIKKEIETPTDPERWEVKKQLITNYLRLHRTITFNKYNYGRI